MAIAFEASSPARSDRAVVFACDERYLPYALFAAARLAALSPARGFDICLCSLGGSLPVPASLAALEVRACRIETGGALAGLPLDARRTQAAYLRLALPAAFRGEYRRLLYLDSDVYPQGGDWDALIGVDLGGRAVAAVRDNLQWRTPGRVPAQFRRLGLGHAPYFNSGLLLIDVEAFLAQRVLERCQKLASARPDRLVGLDQELLNAVLHGDWAELSPVWNWPYTRATMLFEAMEEAHLVHFIGPKKPWTDRRGRLPLRFRHAYRTFLAEHFPEQAQMDADGLAPHGNRTYLRSMLLRHLLGLGPTCRLLDAFASDLTVLRGGGSTTAAGRG